MSRVLYAVVSSGATVSANVDLREGQLGAVYLPVVTSADLYVRGCYDTTSANFGRLFNEYGAVRFPTGAGSCMAMWPMGELTPPYVRFELSVAQTDNRTLTVLRY